MRRKAYLLLSPNVTRSDPSSKIWSNTIQPPSSTEIVTILPPSFRSAVEKGNSRICSLAFCTLPSSASLEWPLISNFFSIELIVTFTTERFGFESTRSIINLHCPFLGFWEILNRMFVSCVLQPEVLQVPPQVSSGPGITYGKSVLSEEVPIRKNRSSYPKSLAKNFL